MKITVTSVSSDQVFPLDIPDDLELENFKAFCEAESGLATSDMVILFQGNILADDKKSMSSYGLKDGDVVVVEKRQKRAAAAAAPAAGGLALPDFSQIQLPGTSRAGNGGRGNAGRASRGQASEEDPKYIRDMLLANPDQMSLLRQNNPRLAEALDSGNFDSFVKVKIVQSNL